MYIIYYMYTIYIIHITYAYCTHVSMCAQSGKREHNCYLNRENKNVKPPWPLWPT